MEVYLLFWLFGQRLVRSGFIVFTSVSDLRVFAVNLVFRILKKCPHCFSHGSIKDFSAQIIIKFKGQWSSIGIENVMLQRKKMHNT